MGVPDVFSSLSWQLSRYFSRLGSFRVGSFGSLRVLRARIVGSCLKFAVLRVERFRRFEALLLGVSRVSRI